MSRESIGLMLDISVRQNKTCRMQFLFPVGLKGVQTATSDTHASTIGICVWSNKSLPSREQFTPCYSWHLKAGGMNHLL